MHEPHERIEARHCRRLLLAGRHCARLPPTRSRISTRARPSTIVVGHEVGTGFDIYSRVLARHLGRHIPGNPNIVVQNMVGASGLTAANWLYNVAPKDGTVMVTFVHTIPFEPLIGNNAARFDAAKFTWIGNMEESVGDLRRLQGRRHRQVRRHADEGDDLRRDRRDRSAR